jgi:general secretion pathway protein M
MNEIKQWFLDQSPRDQLMLSMGGVAVALYLLIFLLLGPMYSNLEAKERRNVAALEEQQRVRELAGQFLARQQIAATSTAGQSLNGLLNQSLAEFGLSMENFQPTDNTARVRLGSSEFNKVVAWLNALEVKQGVQIKDMTITADQTPGSVVVNLQIAWGQ